MLQHPSPQPITSQNQTIVWFGHAPDPPHPLGHHWTPLDTTGHTLALEEATGLRDHAFAAAAGLRDHAFAAAAGLQDCAFASSWSANENNGENEPAGRLQRPVNIAAARALSGAGPYLRSVIWGPAAKVIAKLVLI